MRPQFLNGLTRKIAILASGGGSNARRIVEHFENSACADVVLIAANKAECGALNMAREHGIATYHISRSNFSESDDFLKLLDSLEIDLIVLAGFLWLIPGNLVSRYAGRIINIHPALLPKYGGKGMYGMNVHHAVKEAGEEESGMTIHFVNEKYDEGNIIFQASTSISEDDSADDIAAKVLKLEHQHYPRVIEQLLIEMA